MGKIYSGVMKNENNMHFIELYSENNDVPIYETGNIKYPLETKIPTRKQNTH